MGVDTVNLRRRVTREPRLGLLWDVEATFPELPP